MGTYLERKQYETICIFHRNNRFEKHQNLEFG